MSTSNDKLMFNETCEGDRAKLKTNIQICTYDDVDDHMTLIIEVILCIDLYNLLVFTFAISPSQTALSLNSNLSLEVLI
jgi:hypothetical protein